MNQLLAPWPEKAFQRSNLSVKLANHRGRTELQQTNRQIIIKGPLNITVHQIKDDLNNQGVEILRAHRIISRRAASPPPPPHLYQGLLA